ncbi:unnamed protein product [Nezara viridula]|uniref:Uncharacterized protein n=1 Tax=Nezara viridula TaxID=85310 RepID=A0A9P0HHA5_NEZVI|nr:unnamed protein product [Nezara viridula]
MSPNSRLASVDERPASKLFSVAEIEPACLYLCGASVIRERMLTELGITCLISACPELPELPLPSSVSQCCRLDIRDVPMANIAVHLSPVADLIAKVKEEGGRTLVHCVAGVSRSASLCIGYLMKSKGMSLEEAYNHVLSCRPCIRPNNGFFEQLIQFEKELTGSNSVTMVYNEAAKATIPNVYESDYENTIRYINRSIGIK